MIGRLLRSPRRSIRKLEIHPPCHPSVCIAIGKAMQECNVSLQSLQCTAMGATQAPIAGTLAMNGTHMQLAPVVRFIDLPKAEQRAIDRAHAEVALGVSRSEHITSLGICLQTQSQMASYVKCLRHSCSIESVIIGLHGVPNEQLPGVITGIAQGISGNRSIESLGNLDFRLYMGTPRPKHCTRTLPELAKAIVAHPLISLAHMVIFAGACTYTPAVEQASQVLACGVGGSTYMDHSGIHVG